MLSSPVLHACERTRSAIPRVLLCLALLSSLPVTSRAAAPAATVAAQPDSAQVRSAAPTSAAQMGIAPKRSHKKWLIGGLGIAVLAGVAAMAGGGGSSSTPPSPIAPPPPPPAPAQ